MKRYLFQWNVSVPKFVDPYLKILNISYSIIKVRDQIIHPAALERITYTSIFLDTYSYMDPSHFCWKPVAFLNHFSLDSDPFPSKLSKLDIPDFSFLNSDLVLQLD